MKIHARDCDNVGTTPCTKEHKYLCAYCDNEFVTSGETHYKFHALVFASQYWPYCSAQCARDYLNSIDTLKGKIWAGRLVDMLHGDEHQ
jgi:hypothetical protein